MGMITGAFLTSSVVLIIYEQHDNYAALLEQLEARGVAIGVGLATQSQDLILTDNRLALHYLLQEASEAYDDIVYIFILDANGEVIEHTFEGGVPTDLLNKNEVPRGVRYQMQKLQTERDTIHDVAVPVLGGKAGVVRLGMSEASAQATVTRQMRTILIWVVPVMVVGLTVAYALSSIVFKPITQLAQAVTAVGKGDFLTWKSPSWAKDEIGALGTAFVEMSKELRQKEEMRQQLLANVLHAQEDERKRIARELHDETSQALTSVIIGLKMVEDSLCDPHTGERLSELRALTSQTLDEVHRMATALRPSLLDDLGLVDALQRYVAEYSAKTQINVDSHINIAGQHLPSDVEIAVFRIIQEALTNIAKHAKATDVSVVVQNRGSSLVAIIEDNGAGFDIENTMSASDQSGLGLFGMHERASLVGGKLTIESKIGSGTTVFLQVPLTLNRESTDEEDNTTHS